MPDLDVTLAGAVSLRRGHRRVGERAFGARQLRLVTAMLVLERDGPVSIDLLAGELWPDQPPARWKVAVRGLVSQFRRHLVDLGLEADAVVGDQGRYIVELGDVRVDLEVASGDVVGARRSVDAGAIDRATRLAGSARSVLSRPVLSGVDAEWLDRLRDRVARDHLESLVLLGECRRRLGAPVDARRVLTEAIGIDPLREDAWRALMRAEAAAGNVARALGAYEDCRRRLADEFGVDPAEETQRLHAELLQSVPDPDDLTAGPRDPDPLSTPTSRDLVPYVGLRAFTVAEADRFFGRDAEVQALVDRLARHGIVAVVGPSGVGKSSLVRAGLLPALAHGAIPDADTWLSVVMTPTAAPRKALAAGLIEAGDGVDQRAVRAAVAGGGDGLHDAAGLVLADSPSTSRLLLVVDQFEEVFTLGRSDPAEAFVGLLTAASGRLDRRVVVVVTLRADFYDRAADVSGLADLLSHSQFVVPPLEGDQVEAAITGPARHVGVNLEPGLLGRIVADVAGEPGSLPLLQHLLFELWDHRVDRVLTRGAYDDLGGVTGALAHRAEQVYVGLEFDERAVARRILLRAVQPGEEGGDVRRPVPADELHGPGDDPAKIDRVVDRLVDARLLTAGTHAPGEGRTLELAHEALIDGWPRLRGWVDEARGWLLDHRRLTRAAQEWITHDRQDDWLLGGLPLDEAHDLVLADGRGDVDLHLSPVEHELVQASLEARELVRAWEAEREQRRRELERRSRRRLRALVVVAMLVAAAAAFLWYRAQAQGAIARVEALVAESRLALAEDPELAVLLGLEAHDRLQDAPGLAPEVVAGALHEAVAAQRVVRHFPDAGKHLALAPDGQVFVGARQDAGSSGAFVLEIRDAVTGEVTAGLDGEVVAKPSAAFTPDGSVLLVGSGDTALQMWDPGAGVLLGHLDAPDDLPVGQPDVHPDGRLVAGVCPGSDDTLPGRVVVWDIETLETVNVMEFPDLVATEFGIGSPGRAVFSPDGTLLAVTPGATGGDTRVIDTQTWDEAFRVQGEDRTVPTAGWSPDGRWLAVGGNQVRVVDAESGQLLVEMTPTGGLPGLGGLAWTPDSQRIVVGSATLEIWDPMNVRPWPVRLAAPGLGNFVDVHVAPDGATAYTSSWIGAGVRVWDVSPDAGAEVARLPAGSSSGVAWSPDGGTLAVHGPTTRGAEFLDLWDTTTWARRRHELPEHRWLPDIAWSGDGRVALAGAVASVRDLSAPEPAFVVDTADAEGIGWSRVDFHPDGDLVAVAGSNSPDWFRRVSVFDPGGSEVARLETDQRTPFVQDMAFSPQGDRLAMVVENLDRAEEAAVEIWDWSAGQRVHRIEVPVYQGSVAWAPDGDRIVTGGGDAIVRVFDVDEGRQLLGMEGHDLSILGIDWAPDGRLVATGGDDGRVHLWDPDTGVSFAAITIRQDLIPALAFSPDGSRLAATADDGEVWVWTMDLEELVGMARSRVSRGLTDAECREYLGVEECPT